MHGRFTPYDIVVKLNIDMAPLVSYLNLGAFPLKLWLTKYNFVLGFLVGGDTKDQVVLKWDTVIVIYYCE